MRIWMCLAVLCGVAHADQTLHAGLDVRTDLGAHHTRLPIGMRWEKWGATAVIDPMYLLDGEHDLDLLGEYFFGPRIGVMAGWRWTTIAVNGGHHQQQRSLIGVTAVGPEFFGGRVRTSGSLELATLWVSYGGGAMTEWITAGRSIMDNFALGLFARIEYAWTL